MGFYGNIWLKNQPVNFDDTLIFAIESDLNFYDDLLINESVILEAFSLSSIMDKIKEYWIKLKKWFKEKISFIISKAKEFINKYSFGKNDKFDKSKNMKNDKETSKDDDENKEYSVEGMYYNEIELGISHFSSILVSIYSAYVSGYSNLEFDNIDYEKLDESYDDFKEKIDKINEEELFASKVQEKKYNLKTKSIDSFCADLEYILRSININSTGFTDLIKRVKEEYIKCDKQISEFDKEVSDCISKIKEFQGNDTNSSSLNYYKDKIKKNKYALDKESDIKSKFQSSFEKDQVKWYNKSIKAYSVKLKMLKDSLQKTKDVGFKAVEYTQQLFTYAQHNKTEYNKLLKIYNELK